jgi:hypothetical protein
MPNWVYNQIQVSGKREDLLAFAEKASQRHEEQWLSSEWIQNKNGTNTRVAREDRKIEVELSDEAVLSFWNFIRPTDEELPYYFGHKVKDEDKDDPNATKEERLAKALTFSGAGSYDWNIRNWDTKWDACNPTLGTDLDELTGEYGSLHYSFDTAWSVPHSVFLAMVRQHPELNFDFESEEEQGWGVKFTSSDGDDEGEERSLIETESWDIPESHADYKARDNEDNCACANYEDEDDWYKDCPRPESEYVVIVQRTYKITTDTPATAWEIANNKKPAELDEYEVETEMSVYVRDEDGNKIYPNLSDFDLTSD